MANQPKPYSVAPGDRERERILSPLALVGVILLSALALVLVFPENDLLSRLQRQGLGKDRELTLSYLRNLRTSNTDLNLRFLLAEKLLQAGEFPDAKAELVALEPLLTQDDQRRRWSELDALVLFDHWRFTFNTLQNARVATHQTPAAVPAVSPETVSQLEREEAVARAGVLRYLMLKANTATSAVQVFALIAQARDLQSRELQVRLYQRLLVIPGVSMADLLRGGREALVLGDAEDARQLYLAASQRTTNAEARRNAVMLAVKIQLAEGKPVEAYQSAVQWMGEPAPEDFFTWALIDLATSAGKPSEAARWWNRMIPPQWDAATLAAKLKPEDLRRSVNVLLAGADLPGAVRAMQALQRAGPLSVQEQERLAQVIEWSGQPAAAMALWVELAQRDASAQALDNLFRLGPMLYDDEVLLMAWNTLARKKTLSVDQVSKVVQAYERVGDPTGAVEFLRKEMDASVGKPLMGDARADSARVGLASATSIAAPTTPGLNADASPNRAYQLWSLRGALLERAGREKEALTTLQQLHKLSGKLLRDDAFRYAFLALRQGGQYDQAYVALEAYEAPSAKGFDVEYWSIRADIAYEAARIDDMVDALEHLRRTDSNKNLLKEYQAVRLVNHYQDIKAFAKAVDLLDEAVQTQPAPALLVLWMTVLAADPSEAALSRLLAKVPASLASELENNVDFVERRAIVRAATGDRKQARQDYLAAYRLQPLARIRVSYLWLLIDQGDKLQLRKELAASGARDRNDPQYLEVMGASWQLLGEPRKALLFYRQQAPSKANDYLWLANYADVLDGAGDSAQAWRVKRHAFDLLRTELGRMTDVQKKETAQALIVRIRLSETFGSALEKERLATLLGTLLTDNQLAPELRRQANDLVISWALGGEREELARRWLWAQQVKRVDGAEYAALALALVDQDKDALARLMDRSEGKFQVNDRLSALRILGRTAQAASVGAELAQSDPEAQRNEEQQQALDDDLRKLASRVSVTSVARKADVLHQSGVQVRADIALTPSLRLTSSLTLLTNRTLDTAVLAAVPPRDQEMTVGVRKQIDGGEVSATLTQRTLITSVTGLILKVAKQLTSLVGVNAELSTHQRSTDGAAMAVGGTQSKAGLAISYKMARDIAISADASLTRYRTQGGAPLGSGSAAGANAIWFIRREYPDLQVKLGIRRNRTKANGQPDPLSALLNPGGTIPAASFFIAPGGTTVSASVGFGLTQSEIDGEVYSRAWRPWGEIGVEHRLGGGANTNLPVMGLGVRGSVLGRDQLVMGVEMRPSTTGRASREARIQYEWIGDR